MGQKNCNSGVDGLQPEGGHSGIGSVNALQFPFVKKSVIFYTNDGL
jgi:hypothetical protein